MTTQAPYKRRHRPKIYAECSPRLKQEVEDLARDGERPAAAVIRRALELYIVMMRKKMSEAEDYRMVDRG